MKISVSPLQARISPYRAAAASSVRQLVVPTAITRCPAALVRSNGLRCLFTDGIPFTVHFMGTEYHLP